MIATEVPSCDSSTTLVSEQSSSALSPNTSSDTFLSKFQVSLPKAISALATGVEPSGLPTNFEVTEYDVVCGRGKGSYNRPGNKLFRQIVSAHVDEYLQAKSKLDKSMVLSSIVDQVREQNHGKARFVKRRRDGTWYEIGDDHAREKVGHAIREAMSARNAQPKRAKANQVFQSKQATLLQQQQHIFQDMLELKQANMLIQAELHQAKNMHEALHRSSLVAAAAALPAATSDSALHRTSLVALPQLSALPLESQLIQALEPRPLQPDLSSFEQTLQQLQPSQLYKL